MKIFTLFQNLLKMITGQTGRNLTFKSPKPKAQSLKPNTVLSSSELVSKVNTSVQNAMAPKNDALVSVGYKILPVQNAKVSGSNEIHSVEYKILPVQKKITSVQNIKPVFMQNFFAIVKKIFSLSDHPKTLLENLNDGYHPGCHYGTAGNENISRTNQHHDVANDAASFALIPISSTPTAMNHSEKKSVKTITGRSGLVGILMLMSSLCFVNTALAKATTFTNAAGGAWTTTGNWSNGVPVAGDDVTINATGEITAIPTITLNSLIINGNCTLTTAASGNTITISTTFTVPSGVTVDAGPNNRINTTLANTCTGTIAGTYTQESGGTTRTFTNSGNLTITSTGRINGAGAFVLSGGATLQIGSAVGILTGTGATGNIQVTGARTYSTTASYIYNGGGAQAAGNGLPATVSNLIISNSTTLTLPSAKAITTNFSIATGSSVNLGTFSHTAGTLTLGGQGTVNGTWGSTTSTATNKNNTFFAATTGIVTVSTSTCTPPGVPTVTSPVSYCIGATASPLTATGSNLLWYTVSTGGSGSATAPTPVITSVGSTPYFVSQTIGCEGPRAEIDVVVNPTPSTTVNGSTNITCNGANDGTITIAVTGGTPDYLFSVDGGNTYTPDTHPSPYVFPGLSANTPYTIRVKDAKGCQSQTF